MLLAHVLSLVVISVAHLPSSHQEDIHTEIETKNLTLYLDANLINVDEARSFMSVLISFTLIIHSEHLGGIPVGRDITRRVVKGKIPIPRIDLPNPFCLTGRREIVEARVLQDHRLSLRVRLDSKLPCFPKNSFYYPFDDLNCHLQVWVEGWIPAGTQLDLLSSSPRRSVGAFMMTDSKIEHSSCPEHSVDNKFHGLGGIENCFTLKFLLERRSGRLLASVYLPTGMIVCLTFLLPWITFLVVPARAVVSGLSFLHLANHTVLAREYIPSNSSYTFMDMWLNGCLLSAFFANLGFVLVHRASHGVQKMLEFDATPFDSQSAIGNEESLISIGTSQIKKSTLRRKSLLARSSHPKRIDVWARLVLPTFFLIFNAVYWSIVFSLSHTY